MRHLTLFLIVIVHFASGQNIIPNAGFEHSWSCPNNYGQVAKATGWNNPTTASPDYYNACGHKDYSVPKNRYGEKLSFQGKAYMALNAKKYYREYIQIRLNSPLIKGQKYFCSLHISASETYSIVSSDVGMLFTKEKIKKETAARITDHVPQIENDPDSIFTDYEWHQVSGHFIAKGGEQYLTIGSFRKNVSKVQVFQGRSDREPSWYNFIDNVSTEPIFRKKPKKKIQSELDRLQNINFENRSYDLKGDSIYKLNKVLKILKRNKEISIKVIGHTDSNGSESENRTLSVQRCIAVKHYLTTHGIARKRILTEGKGDSEPLLPNTTDENRIKNRRVEFRVM
jgi:OOP family OmpA-OmpF porin